MVISYRYSKKMGWRGEARERNAKTMLKAIWAAKWALMVPVIILGGIYGGIMTPTDLTQVIEKAPVNEQMRVWIEGEDINGKLVKKGMLIPLGEAGTAAQRLEGFGLRLMPTGEQIDVISVKFRSKADKAGFQQGQKVISLEVENTRPAPEWIHIPTLGVLALVIFLQRRRVVPEPRPAIA